MYQLCLLAYGRHGRKRPRTMLPTPLLMAPRLISDEMFLVIMALHTMHAQNKWGKHGKASFKTTKSFTAYLAYILTQMTANALTFYEILGAALHWGLR
jgi:hypothetical protein